MATKTPSPAISNTKQKDMSIDDLFRLLSAQNTEILHRLTTAFSGLREFATETEQEDLSSDPVNQRNTFRGYLNVLGDSQSKDESKLRAAQELNENFDVIIAHSQYQTFLDHAIRVFIKLLQEGTSKSIAELHIHKVRKLVLR